VGLDRPTHAAGAATVLDARLVHSMEDLRAAGRADANIAAAMANSAAPRLDRTYCFRGTDVTQGMVEAGWSDAQADCRRLFEGSSQPMWVREGGKIVEVNRAALLHYGYSRDEFLAMTIGDLVSTEDPAEEHSPENLHTGEAAKNPPAFSVHRRKDGSFIDVEVTSFAVTFSGRPASMDCIVDVTYRRKTEAQARYLDLLLANVTDAVVTSDDNFILTGWNAAAEATYGRRADEVLGQLDTLVFRTNFVGVEGAEAIRRLVETGRFHGELTYHRGDGRDIHIESHSVALFDGDGKRLGYVSVNRDVTERTYAEEAIRSLLKEALTAQEVERGRLAHELHEETAQTLAALLLDLRAVDESQDLGVALGLASRLRGSVSVALEGVQRIARELRPSVLDDLGLADALERLGTEVSQSSGFVVDVHATGPRLPRLAEALETALYRVAQEALTNASKHASPNAVSILIHRNPGELRLLIEDDGKGFDATDTFSPVQLGLAGMRERVHVVGGSVTIESSPGHGTTIFVIVPLPGLPMASS
jgi:PAS domain S-box-containing protein